jgi:aminopeptidase-like protein
MQAMVDKLWLKNRAIISDGFKESLDYIQSRIPINVYKAKSGTKCFDWTVPKKWNIREAYIEVEGQRILDIETNPLHVLIGSGPVDKKITLEELLDHIYIDNKSPFSVPYVYEHYDNEKWGFCLSNHHVQQLMPLKDKEFYVKIDADHEDGELLIGEYVHIGESAKSIALFAHLDHPAQVQDGLSGCAVLVDFVENILSQMKDNYYTYRVIFMPETIGGLAYLSMFPKRIDDIKFGCCLEMVGVPNQELIVQDAYIPNTELAEAFEQALRDVCATDEPVLPYRSVVVNDDGVFNAPGIEIPTIALTRSASREDIDARHFKGYHTTADSVLNMSWENMYETLSVLIYAVNIMETNMLVKRKYTGIPHLFSRGLWIPRSQDPLMNSKIKEMLDKLRDYDVTILDLARDTRLKYHVAAEFIGAMEATGLVKTRRKTIDRGRVIGA